MKISEIYKSQKAYFRTFETRDVAKRKELLDKICTWIEDHEDDVNAALNIDLGKTRAEAYMTEIGMVYDCFTYINKNIDSWTKKQRTGSALRRFFSKSYTVYEPYGTVLVMSPWNYPFLLAMEPALYAIAAGNTVMIKPSEYAPATSHLIATLFEEVASPEYVAVIEGDVRVSRELLTYAYDYIFFTGSSNVGEVVYKRAAAHLTPVTLELGGKSPVIVTDEVDVNVAAKRIAFGKFLNAGQTCVAPDYVFVKANVKEAFIEAVAHYIEEFFGSEPLKSNSLCKIINRKHFNRLLNLMDGESVVIGGQIDEHNLKIAPTVIDAPDPDSAIMKQEIFGPVMPVLTYDNLDDVITFINDRPKPLALYLFTENEATKDQVLTQCQFGGGCINDTIMHLSDHDLPFGGIGASGLGQYHGAYSFQTFSHKKAIMDSSTKRDLNFRYYPIDEDKEYQIRKNLK